MATIPSKITSFLNRVVPQAKKELKLIRAHDWTKDKSIKGRETTYKMHRILVRRSIDNMETLYKMAEKAEIIGNPKIKNALKLLRDFYVITDERYTAYIQDTSWMEEGENETEDQKKKRLQRAEAEAKLQSTMLDDINNYEATLDDINDGEENHDVDIELYKSTPHFPLMMIDKICDKYPEVKTLLENKTE